MLGVDLEAVAAILAEVAADEIMPRWRNLAAGDVTKKAGGGSLVTIADEAAERALTRRLSALLPGSIVVGEEAVAADPTVLERFRSPQPVWVVDPIDGTRKFAEGKPTFDVLVALVVAGRGVAGWIYAPAEQDLYMGEAGSGVIRRTSDGVTRRLRADTGRPLSALDGIVSPQGFLNRRLPDPERVRGRFRGYTRHVCAGHNYSRLLRGESDFLINFATLPWDHVAGLILATEAGFHHARLDAAPFDPLDSKGGILVAPDRQAWHEIVAALLPGTGKAAHGGA